MLSPVKSNLKKHIDARLVEKLLEHYCKIKEKYRLWQHESTELNAGKFSEVVVRILEYVTSSPHKYTPLDRHIQNFFTKCSSFTQLPKLVFDESTRIHIPRTLILIHDIRNKRSVGHVSGIHSPNLMDSTFVVKSADWIMGELIRLYHGCSTDEAQRLVDRLIQIDLPLVADLGDVKRVLDPKMSYAVQVLVLLYQSQPNKVREADLIKWTEHSNATVFRRDVLRRLHRNREIEYANDGCLILPPGITRIEQKLAQPR